ncbi:MAG: hypothetical protein D8B56_06135 [Alloprevotella sp.]|nr:MAG: hypothetical protein D8B56_06135 [Alloprevotella sp.]
MTTFDILAYQNRCTTRVVKVFKRGDFHTLKSVILSDFGVMKPFVEVVERRSIALVALFFD